MVFIIAGIVMLLIGVSTFVSAVMSFMGKKNAIVGFDLRNIPEDKFRKFGFLAGLDALLSTTLSIIGGVLTLVYQTNLMLYISIGLTVGGMVIYMIILLILVKIYNGKIITN